MREKIGALGERSTATMSKFSPKLKALISAPFARPNTLAASPRVRSVYEALRTESSAKDVGDFGLVDVVCESGLSEVRRGVALMTRLQTAATMTMNSPDGLTQLYNLATSGSKDKNQSVETAEIMREVGLKCIGFNGACPPSPWNCLRLTT